MSSTGVVAIFIVVLSVSMHMRRPRLRLMMPLSLPGLSGMTLWRRRRAGVVNGELREGLHGFQLLA